MPAEAAYQSRAFVILTLPLRMVALHVRSRRPKQSSDAVRTFDIQVRARSNRRRGMRLNLGGTFRRWIRAPSMPRILAPAVLCVLVWASGVAFAYDCAPHCDYVHDYGPYDLSWVSPGLVGIPVCDRQGNCSPHLVYRQFGHPWPGIRITIRPTNRARPHARR